MIVRWVVAPAVVHQVPVATDSGPAPPRISRVGIPSEARLGPHGLPWRGLGSKEEGSQTDSYTRSIYRTEVRLGVVSNFTPNTRVLAGPPYSVCNCLLHRVYHKRESCPTRGHKRGLLNYSRAFTVGVR